MAELVWRDKTKTSGVVAEYNSHGATVKIVLDEQAAPMPAVPEWVGVGQTLMIRRCQEYREATGHLPARELLERFDAAMAERLRRLMEAPRKHPFRPMSLIEFEREANQETQEEEACFPAGEQHAK